MKKMKRLLVAITIIVIVVISLGGIALSAQVHQINKWKGHVFIDVGEDEGYMLGATVCFISCKSEELICGTVQMTSPSEAMVKVDNRATKMRKICGGSEALLYVREEEKEEMKEDEENEEKNKDPEGINKKDWFK